MWLSICKRDFKPFSTGAITTLHTKEKLRFYAREKICGDDLIWGYADGTLQKIWLSM
jgi:hypothetical protein